MGGGGAGTGAEGGDGAFGEGAEFEGGVLGGVEGSPVVGRSSNGSGTGGGIVEAAEGGVRAAGVEGLDSLGGRCHEDDFGASGGDGDSFGEGRLGVVVVMFVAGSGNGSGGGSRIVLSDDLAFEEQFEQRAVDVIEWK